MISTRQQDRKTETLDPVLLLDAELEQLTGERLVWVQGEWVWEKID